MSYLASAGVFEYIDSKVKNELKGVFSLDGYSAVGIFSPLLPPGYCYRAIIEFLSSVQVERREVPLTKGRKVIRLDYINLKKDKPAEYMTHDGDIILLFSYEGEEYVLVYTGIVYAQTPPERLYLYYRDREKALALVGRSKEYAQRSDKKSKLIRVVGDGPDIYFKNNKVTCESVFIDEKIKGAIIGSLEWFFSPGGRAFYESKGLIYKRGIMMVGPPGNGKTMLIKAIINMLDVRVIYFTLNERAGLGKSLEEMGMMIKNSGPTLVIIEDLDTLFEETRNVSKLLNLLDGVDELDGIFFIATANNPDKISPALLSRPSRFDRIFTIDIPGPEKKLEYLRSAFGNALPEKALWENLDRLACLSMAYMKELYVYTNIVAQANGRQAPSEDDFYTAVRELSEQQEGASRSFKKVAAVGFR